MVNCPRMEKKVSYTKIQNRSTCTFKSCYEDSREYFGQEDTRERASASAGEIESERERMQAIVIESVSDREEIARMIERAREGPFIQRNDNNKSMTINKYWTNSRVANKLCYKVPPHYAHTHALARTHTLMNLLYDKIIDIFITHYCQTIIIASQQVIDKSYTIQR